MVSTGRQINMLGVGEITSMKTLPIISKQFKYDTFFENTEISSKTNIRTACINYLDRHQNMNTSIA